MKKIFSLFMLLLLILNTFTYATDIEISDWAKSEVEGAINSGFVPVDMQNNYTKPITRAEFAKISVMFVAYMFDMKVDVAVKHYLDTHFDGAGKPLTFKEDTFADINDSKHKYYIKYANSLNIVNGKGDGMFDPDSPITREEAATMLLRTYFCYGGGVKLGPKSEGVDAFVDANEISSWADSAVRYMYQWDVMKGVSDLRYAPKETYTREQCYVTFLRLNNF